MLFLYYFLLETEHLALQTKDFLFFPFLLVAVPCEIQQRVSVLNKVETKLQLFFFCVVAGR